MLGYFIMSKHELSTPQEWRAGLVEIRDNAQAAIGPNILESADVTPEVLELADKVWGWHDVSPDMKIEVATGTATMPFPYLYAKDRVAKEAWHNIGTLQGAYLDPETGLLVVQKPEIVYDWLQGRELPAESPFAFAREVTEAQFGKDALKALLPAIHERRNSLTQITARSEEERARNEAQKAELQALINSDPLLRRLTEGMTDDNQKALAEYLRRLGGNGMMVWHSRQWGASSSPPTFEEAKSIVEEHGGSSEEVLAPCPGPGAIC